MAVNISKERSKIAGMFNSIAPNYDLLNHLLSFGIDRYWRSLLIKKVMQNSPQKVLDIACGTGDVTISLALRGVEVIGLDIASKMLEIASKKVKRREREIKKTPHFVCASAETLPFPDDSFDAVTIGFGIRNFEKRGESLLEIKRVLKPGGQLGILEFATPKNRFWRALFNLYFLKILPFIGRMISGDKSAYSYLPLSVETFPQYSEFSLELENLGFLNASYRSLTGGVSVLYTANKSSS